MRTLLLVDQEMGIGINANDDQIRQHIARANEHQDLRIVERNLLRHLHHHKDDHKVGSAQSSQYRACENGMGVCFVHLRTKRHFVEQRYKSIRSWSWSWIWKLNAVGREFECNKLEKEMMPWLDVGRSMENVIRKTF